MICVGQFLNLSTSDVWDQLISYCGVQPVCCTVPASIPDRTHSQAKCCLDIATCPLEDGTKPPWLRTTGPDSVNGASLSFGLLFTWKKSAISLFLYTF